jgi:hypothetical protein
LPGAPSAALEGALAAGVLDEDAAQILVDERQELRWSLRVAGLDSIQHNCDV